MPLRRYIEVICDYCGEAEHVGSWIAAAISGWQKCLKDYYFCSKDHRTRFIADRKYKTKNGDR